MSRKPLKFPKNKSSYPTANGKVFEIDMDSDKKNYKDKHHTDRLDNFTSMEVELKSRCNGMPLEMMVYDITPIGEHYVFIHFDIPVINADLYKLKIFGQVKNELLLSMQDIKKRPSIRMPVTMQCAGNGRTTQKYRYINHVPWNNNDAIGTYIWTGVALVDLLKEAILLQDATHVIFTGYDKGIQGNEVQYYQRTLDLNEVLNGDLILAYEMNDTILTPKHGFPLRLIVPGWLGTASVKWLSSIEIVNHKHASYQDRAYIYGKNPTDPNATPVTVHHVRALMIPPGIPDFFTRIRYIEESTFVKLAGRAWSGGGIQIKNVQVSIDGGKNYEYAKLAHPLENGKYAWIGWTFDWDNVIRGEYTLRVKATDEAGNIQIDEDDSANNYYAMDVNKPQYVNVVVVEKGTLDAGSKLNVPVRFESH